VLSEHIQLEIANADHHGHRPGERPPLRDGDPVPGCSCSACTGVPDGSVISGRFRREGSFNGESLSVEAARGTPISTIVVRLGLGEPKVRGKRAVLQCPFHDDRRPSMRLALEKGLWYCDPCAVGGDGISLVQQYLGVDFPTAVRWITDR
jgi:hypothetical protein